MQAYETLMLAGMFVIGAATSYEDIKEGRIRNKWVALGLLYSICITFFYAALLYERQNAVPLSLLAGYVLNIAAILIIGLALWKLDFWTAADAKLAAALASLVPVSYTFGFPYAPFIIVLLNAFLIAFASLFVILLLTTSLKEKAKVLTGLKPKSVIESAVFVFGFSWAAKLLLKLMGIEQSMFAALAIVLLFLLALRHLVIDYTPLAVALSVLHIALGFSSFTISYLAMLALLLLIFIIITKLVIGLSALKFGQAQETVPFAPILFAATLLTLAIGNAAAWLETAIEIFL